MDKMNKMNDWIKDEMYTIFSADFTNIDFYKRYCFIKWGCSEKKLSAFYYINRIWLLFNCNI